MACPIHNTDDKRICRVANRHPMITGESKIRVWILVAIFVSKKSFRIYAFGYGPLENQKNQYSCMFSQRIRILHALKFWLMLDLDTTTHGFHGGSESRFIRRNLALGPPRFCPKCNLFASIPRSMYTMYMGHPLLQTLSMQTPFWGPPEDTTIHKRGGDRWIAMRSTSENFQLH